MNISHYTHRNKRDGAFDYSERTDGPPKKQEYHKVLLFFAIRDSKPRVKKTVLRHFLSH